MSDPVEEALSEIKAGRARPLYLVWGEEFLARRVTDALCDALVPAGQRDLNFISLDASAGGREVALHLDTVPMFRGTKVVFVEGADVLLAKRDVEKELARAKELWNQPNRKKDAARRLLALVAPAGWTAREIDPDSPTWPPKTRWKKEVGLEPDSADRPFFAEVARYCIETDLKAPRDDAEALQRSVTSGPPRGNHLVLLCEEFDPKHAVARAAAERGLVIGRQVAKAPRGKGADALDIGALTHEVLTPLGKRLTPGAARLLKSRVGEAMRQLASEMEKLATYTGDRATIEERDVELLVASVREEDYFELSDALGAADAGRALKLIQDDLARGKPPIMLLAGITGAVRRLATDAARLARVPGALAGRELGYDDFKSRFYPAYLEGVSGQPPHPFYVFSNYQRVRRHGVRRLLGALVLCAQVDEAMKTGGGPLALERLVLAVCTRPR